MEAAKNTPRPLLWWSGFFTLVLLLPVVGGLLGFYASAYLIGDYRYFCEQLVFIFAPLMAFALTWLAGRLAYAAARAMFAADAWRWTVLSLLYSQIAYWIWAGLFLSKEEWAIAVLLLTLLFLAVCAAVAVIILKKTLKASPSGHFRSWLVVSLLSGILLIPWNFGFIITVCYLP